MDTNYSSHHSHRANSLCSTKMLKLQLQHILYSNTLLTKPLYLKINSMIFLAGTQQIQLHFKDSQINFVSAIKVITYQDKGLV